MTDKWHFIGNAERAMQMQGAAGNVVIDLGHRRFYRSNVFADLAIILVLVDQPRRAQHQKAELLQLNPRIGHLFLYHLLF